MPIVLARKYPFCGNGMPFTLALLDFERRIVYTEITKSIADSSLHPILGRRFRAVRIFRAAFLSPKEDAMVHLELDDEETALLQQTLEDCLSDLRGEIADTYSHDYKDMLKSKKVLLLKIQEALNQASLEPLHG